MIHLPKHFWWFITPSVLFFIVSAVFALMYDKGTVLLWLNGHHCSLSDIFFKYFTFLGDGWMYLIVGGLLLVIRKQRSFVALLIILISQNIPVQLMKRVFFADFDRPLSYFKDMGIHLIEGVKVYSHHSFPSGHTASAFALYAFLGLLFNDKRITVVCFFIAALVGISRLILFQHFLVDVLFGGIIGLVTTILVYSYYPGFKKELFQRNE